MDAKTQIELEAATFRALVDHLQNRTEVQNIDIMNLAASAGIALPNGMLPPPPSVA
jgi:hypothetical protein